MIPQVVYDDGTTRLIHGHVIDALKSLEPESITCAVTSPPYLGLRAYGTDPQVWGGDPNCGHAFVKEILKPQSGGQGAASAKQVTNGGSQDAQARISRGQCVNCDAWLGEYGHEPTPQQYIANTMLILREIHRVLKPSGVLFWNCGDSYAGSGKGPPSKNGLTKQHSNMGSITGTSPTRIAGIKPKDLLLIPERFAIAAQDNGWYVRSRIAWCKKAPMPESVKDRPTSAWEHIYMLTKSATYYFNADAGREHSKTVQRMSPNSPGQRLFSEERQEQSSGAFMPTVQCGERETACQEERGASMPPLQQSEERPPSVGHNMWNYWLVSPKPMKGAHFATFPPSIPERLIRVASKPGDTILDPFSGSATTNVVARDLGRKSIGIELQRKYLDEIAIPRVKKIQYEAVA